MTKPDLITLLSPSLTGGGAERVMLRLSNSFIKRGFLVDLVILYEKGELIGETPNGVRLLTLNCAKPRDLIWPLYKYLRQSRPRVLLTAHSSINWAAFLAFRLARCNSSCVAREENTLSVVIAQLDILTRFLRPKFLRWFGRGYHFIAVSKGAAADLIDTAGIKKKDVTVIYNPVIDQEIIEKSREAVKHPWLKDKELPVILAVGRLEKAKGFDILLDAFARLIKNTKAKLLILGEGKERVQLELQRHRLGLDELVDLPGFTMNPYAFMRNADVFVLSSRWEGLGNVLIEALAVGTKIVATNCPNGPYEILDGGRFGLLVEPEDTIGLEKALFSALNNQYPSEKPKKWLHQFSVDVAVDKHLKIMGLPKNTVTSQ